MDEAERQEWINRVWAHYRESRLPGARHFRTEFWHCVRATIALLLDREDDTLLEFDKHDESFDVAFRSLGSYQTDYGTGHSFEFLTVQGFSYAVGSDGTL